MVFNLRNNKDLIWVVLLLLVFNVIEYLVPSRVASVSAYVVGALSFISVIEICQYIVKPFTPKSSRFLTFFIFIIGAVIFFNLEHGLFGEHYVYGADAGCVIAIILKFVRKKD
ncbi:MAG: hypothetical protein ABI388_04640 [Bacteroidia bacterium]